AAATTCTTGSTHRTTRFSKSTSPTPNTSGARSSACAGTQFPRSPTCARRSAESPIRQRPSTAGTRSRHPLRPHALEGPALVELNRSVLHSFDRAGVTVTDHHTESRRLLDHLGRAQRKGCRVGADWPT